MTKVKQTVSPVDHWVLERFVEIPKFRNPINVIIKDDVALVIIRKTAENEVVCVVVSRDGSGSEVMERKVRQREGGDSYIRADGYSFYLADQNPYKLSQAAKIILRSRLAGCEREIANLREEQERHRLQGHMVGARNAEQSRIKLEAKMVNVIHILPHIT